jgi:integrase
VTPAKSSFLRTISPEERERLLSALKSESDKIMLQLLLDTGLPLEDLLGAKASDLDRDRGLLRLRKGGERKGVGKKGGGGRDGEGKEDGEVRKDDEGGEADAEEIPLSPELMKTLIEHLETHPGKVYLFEGRCGKPVSPKWIRCAIEPAAERLGLGSLRSSGTTDSGTDRK